MPSGIKNRYLLYIYISNTGLCNEKMSVLRCFYIGALIRHFLYRIVFSRRHLMCNTQAVLTKSSIYERSIPYD